jgi:predicted extracellular nuclease
MRNILIHIIIFNIVTTVFSQEVQKQNFKIICYNVENYFDCVDDPLTDDKEYLPTGMRGWNTTKYMKKQANIARVITAIGGWEAPAIVGLCEIESNKCLVDLTRNSGLKTHKYRFLHHESPDARGIDVALLYQPGVFKPIHDEALRVQFPFAPLSKTRDILFVSGVVPTGDTLHVFVCHFPSRLGGELESEVKRMYVAKILRIKTDSLFAASPRPNIVIMGDFNDYPTNKSMSEVLQALPLKNPISNQNLYNLMFDLHAKGKGSNKHEGEWGALDQLIVSGNLLNENSAFFTRQKDAHFFEAEFLLEADKRFLGTQPFRTYVGMKYQDGFSDHLPVYADFWY